MKKLIKLALIIFVIVMGVKLIDQYRGDSATLLGVVVCGLVIIWVIRRSGGSKAKSSGGGSSSSSGGSRGVTRDEWYKLHDLTRIYSGYQSLRDYAKVEFSVSLDEYNTFTIDAYLDLSDCASDVNMNDIRSSLNYAVKRLQKNLMSDARSITSGNVRVRTGHIG
ncbi:MAG: hypothetical protein J6S04_06645 [Clostridia bacterium]|nr:hypothetical protein [Clostridia bacterium]